jgi:hypothetical protein
MFRKMIAAAALVLGLSAVALSPAEARGFGGGGFRGGGGFHGGFGGFRGGFGGFHHGFVGGFHPGFGGFHQGFAFHRFDHRFAFRRRFFPFVAVGAGGYGGYGDNYDYGYPYYDTCYWQRAWVWNGFHRVLQLVQVCPGY